MDNITYGRDSVSKPTMLGRVASMGSARRGYRHDSEEHWPCIRNANIIGNRLGTGLGGALQSSFHFHFS